MTAVANEEDAASARGAGAVTAAANRKDSTSACGAKAEAVSATGCEAQTATRRRPLKLTTASDVGSAAENRAKNVSQIGKTSGRADRQSARQLQSST